MVIYERNFGYQRVIQIVQNWMTVVNLVLRRSLHLEDDFLCDHNFLDGVRMVIDTWVGINLKNGHFGHARAEKGSDHPTFGNPPELEAKRRRWALRARTTSMYWLFSPEDSADSIESEVTRFEKLDEPVMSRSLTDWL